jgi:hypothetical protein
MQDSEPKINCVIPKQNLQKPSSLREEVPQRNRDSRNGTFALKPYVEDNFIKQTTKAYLENKATVVDRTKNNIFAKLLKMSSVARRPHNLRAENIRKHYWYV